MADAPFFACRSVLFTMGFTGLVRQVARRHTRHFIRFSVARLSSEGGEFDPACPHSAPKMGGIDHTGDHGTGSCQVVAFRHRARPVFITDWNAGSLEIADCAPPACTCGRMDQGLCRRQAARSSSVACIAVTRSTREHRAPGTPRRRDPRVRTSSSGVLCDASSRPHDLSRPRPDRSARHTQRPFGGSERFLTRPGDSSGFVAADTWGAYLVRLAGVPPRTQRIAFMNRRSVTW